LAALPDSGETIVDLDQTPSEPLYELGREFKLAPGVAIGSPDGSAAHYTTALPFPCPSDGVTPAISDRTKPSALATLGLSLLAALLVLWNTGLFCCLIVGMPQNDFCRMYYSAHAYWHGEDMYGWNPATPAKLDEDTSVDLWNLNPPHYHLALLPLGALPLEAALACWWAMSFLCLSLCLRWIIRELGLNLTPRLRQLGLVALLGFTGTATMILTSQLSFLLLVPITLAWIGARRGRWFRCGLWLGIALSVKPFLLLLVPYLLVRRRWSAVAGCAGAAMLCFALGFLVFGTETHLSWSRGLNVAVTWAWLPLNASLEGMLQRTFRENLYFTHIATLSPHDIRLLSMGLSGVIALLTLIASKRDSSPTEVDRSFALLLTASVMLCPLGWAYYFWLPLGPTVALMAAWKRQGAPVGWPAVWSRRLFWIGFAGLFCPIQLLGLGQPFPLATVLIANMYFWTILGIWLGLLLDAWAANTSRSALLAAA
jgi:alpha-1,2-mannosyltransferase